MTAALREALTALDRSPALQTCAGDSTWLSLVVLAIAQEWRLDTGERQTPFSFARQLDGGAAA